MVVVAEGVGWGWGRMLLIMHIPRAHTRPPNQNPRECGLEICILSKQVALLKVYAP